MLPNGLITATITPFSDGKVDFVSFEKLLLKQIEASVDAVLVTGSTGEYQTLSYDETKEIFDFSVKICKGKIPVIAGVGTNNTNDTVAMAKTAEACGVDYLMVVVPYYNKPNQEGIYQHFKAINDQVDIPIVAYNNPGRTGVDLTLETMIRLAKLDKIEALKESTADLQRVTELLNVVGDKISVFCGDDTLALGFNAQGASGCFSVASNVLPKCCKKMQNLWFDNKVTEAMELQKKIYPLYQALLCDTNPVPVKYLASLMDICRADVRLPLVNLDEGNKKIIQEFVDSNISLLKEYE